MVHVMAWRDLYTKDEHDNLKYTNMMGQHYEEVRGHSMFNTFSEMPLFQIHAKTENLAI